MQKSAVILAGGFSRRFGSDKGLVLLMTKPLVRHVIDKVSPAVDEILVVVNSETQKKTFEPIIQTTAKLVIDKDNSQSPLVGAISGFEKAEGDYSVLLPCDAPLVSTPIIQFLFDTCFNQEAAIPRWPNGYIEPLQAVYHTESALTAAQIALNNEHKDMRSMINNLREVRYISTMALEQIEPNLSTFFNVNTTTDLKKAEELLR